MTDAKHEAPAEPVSDRYKFDDEIAWLREAARYFSVRDTKGEDGVHWANVYNAENARKLADRLAELSSNPCQLEAPAEGAVAWAVKDYADGWIIYVFEKAARASAEARNGALVRPLYVSAAPSADKLREVVQNFIRWAENPADDACGMAREQEWLQHARDALAALEAEGC